MGYLFLIPFREGLLTAFVLLATLPVMIFGLTYHGVLRNDIVARVLTQEAAMAHSLRGHLVSRQQSTLATLAYVRDVLGALSAPGDRRAIMESAAENAGLESLLLLDPAGRVVEAGLPRALRNARASLIGFDLRRQAGVAETITGRTVSWSDASTSPVSGQTVLSVALPAGLDTLVATFQPRYLDAIAAEMEADDSIEVLVLDSHGAVVRSRDSQRDEQRINLSHIPLVADAMARGEATGELDLDHRRLIGTALSLEHIGWVLVVTQDKARATEALDTLKWLGLSAGAGAVVVALLLAVWATNRTARPLQELSAAAKSLSDGTFHGRIRGSVFRELGLLADEFNAMAGQIGRREADLHTTIERLTELNTELERFAYVASHDLQEPLRTITSFSQLLMRDFHGQLGKDGQECLDLVSGAAKRMYALINDLLAYSRLGNDPAPFRLVSAAHMCAMALDDLRQSIDEGGVTVEVGGLPDVVASDVQLVQLFQNLIGNAIKFRRPHAPRVVVGAERQGAFWLFSVTDNGIGLADTNQDVFQIFRRLHPASVYPGTGVGLAVCKRIVERHGGRIWFQSRQNEGSTFFFTLPARDEAISPAPAGSRSNPTPEAPQSSPTACHAPGPGGESGG